MKAKKNVLVVAAHPDDEVLGCGGTIIRHSSKGDEVYLIVFTDGVTSREYKPGIPEAKLKRICSKKIKIRRAEFYKAARILGVKKMNAKIHAFPDNRMDSVPLLDIIKKIEELSETIIFDFVYTHHWGDINIDHRKCFEATLTAFRPSKTSAKIYCFEIPRNMNIMKPRSMSKFCPNTFIDISKQLDKKNMALLEYKSEFANKSPLIKKSEAFCRIR